MHCIKDMSRPLKFYLVLGCHCVLSCSLLPMGAFVVFALVMPATLWFLLGCILGRHVLLDIFSRGIGTCGAVMLRLGSCIFC